MRFGPLEIFNVECRIGKKEGAKRSKRVKKLLFSLRDCKLDPPPPLVRGRYEEHHVIGCILMHIIHIMHIMHKYTT